MPSADITPGAGVVGPNAVIQLGKALHHMCGSGAVLTVFSKHGFSDLIDNPPDRMISEKIPAALMNGVWKHLEPPEAGAVLRDAGRRTADYVIANRIPGAATWLLARAPASIGARVLLKAIHRNAWTFCGSGICTIKTVPALTLTLHKNPLPTPGCIWHVAVFERLFERLIPSRTHVTHRAHQFTDETADRFDFRVV